jgi:hypothetical protein
VIVHSVGTPPMEVGQASKGRCSEIGRTLRRAAPRSPSSPPCFCGPKQRVETGSHGPRLPGRGPWPILALAVTAARFPGFPRRKQICPPQHPNEQNITADVRSRVG